MSSDDLVINGMEVFYTLMKILRIPLIRIIKNNKLENLEPIVTH
jgi:hypothetical protein